MIIENPCIFKVQCRNCNICAVDDRPSVCSSIECEHYSPCSKCNRNMILNNERRCRICAKTSYTDSLASGDGRLSTNEDYDKDVKIDNLAKIVGDSILSDTARAKKQREERREERVRKLKITLPGIPPSEYSQEESDYYKSQWKSYSDYYRDPTIYPMIHNMIILEIELNHITQLLLGTRGEYQKNLLNHRSDIINNLSQIRRMLPEEDALELSEDEKALSMIYETYVREVKARNKDGIKRIFDLPTLALAPVLHFKADLFDILKRLGYKPIDIEEIVKRIRKPPSDPTELAISLGFPINEEVVDDVESDEPLFVEGEEDIEEIEIE